MAMDYVAIIHKDPDSDFGVNFPDFPGCITAGRTLDEAKAFALEALTGHIGVMREAGNLCPNHQPPKKR
jgi:predicted RNase H-like HicB family nuclease